MKVLPIMFVAAVWFGFFSDVVQASSLSSPHWEAIRQETHRRQARSLASLPWPAILLPLAPIRGGSEPGQAGSWSYFREVQSEADRPAPAEPGFRYVFENPRFYIPWIQLDLSPEGTGSVRFRRGESDDTIDQPVKLQPPTLSRIAELIARSGFLTSSEDYQNKRDFAHLGWMTISVNQGGKQRTVRFNYTQNQDIAELAEIFRAISNQAIALFDVDLAIQHQPLDLPKMLDSLENELRLERLAEPDQLIPKLRDIAQDDTLPLISRNQATRLINNIQKGKFRSPVKPSK
jgi:hypothetical protein